MTKRNDPSERPGPGSDSMAIFSGVHQPSAMLLPYNRPNMMRPDYDTSHTRAISGRTLVHPVARQRQPRLMDTSPLHHKNATPRYPSVAVIGMAMVRST